MNRVADIERYLRARLAVDHRPDDTPPDAARHPFVTVSRAAGTGGRDLGEAIVAEFDARSDRSLFDGWRVYDRQVCQLVAEDPRFGSSLDQLLEEEYRSRTNDFFHQMLRSTVDQNVVMDRVFLVVRTIAGMGRAIIIGRAGAQVTRGMSDGVSVRIDAPEEWRIARAAHHLGLPERDARAGCRKRDADRARLLRAHFGADVADPFEYDVVFNAARLDHATMAAAVGDLVAARCAGSEVPTPAP